MQDFPAHLLLPRVLLIDDDMVSREVLATVLTISGYTVHTAADGIDALALLDAGDSNPEVILMDTQMPGLSGAGLLRELRSRARARIFAISGSAVSDEITALADGFLLKPFGSDALRKALEKFVPPMRPSAPHEIDANLPALKPETLASFRESMAEERVREIYTAMMADLARRMDALDEAFARLDQGEVRRIGHSIKGGCAMAGAARIARIGALLESVSFDAESRSGSDQLDNKSGLPNDLRTAAADLERILKVEFPA